MLPEQFRATRKALGLSQAQLAARMGFRSPTVISRLENGHVRVADFHARHLMEIKGREEAERALRKKRSA
jgi:transcriptional regulator with XRE-family HTH domain